MIENVKIEQKHKKANSRIPFLCLVLGAAAIAFSPIFVRLSEVSPTVNVFWRMFLPLPILVSILIFQPRKIDNSYPIKSKFEYLKLCIPGFFFTGDLCTYFWALKFTSVGISTLLSNCAPIFVAFAMYFIFKQKLNRIFFLGLTTAILGVLLIAGKGSNISNRPMLGILLGSLSAIFYSGYIISVAELRAKFRTMQLMLGIELSSSLLLIIAILIAGEKTFPVSFYGWLVLIGLAFVPQFIGHSFITYSLKHLPASFSSVTLLLQPVLASIFAWIILSEKMKGIQIIGGIFVLVGIYISQQSSKKAEEYIADIS